MSVDLQAPCQSVLEAGLASVTGTALTCRVSAITGMGLFIAIADKAVSIGGGVITIPITDLLPLRQQIDLLPDGFPAALAGTAPGPIHNIEAPLLDRSDAGSSFADIPVLVNLCVELDRTIMDTQTIFIYFAIIDIMSSGFLSNVSQLRSALFARPEFSEVERLGGVRLRLAERADIYHGLQVGVSSFSRFIALLPNA